MAVLLVLAALMHSVLADTNGLRGNRTLATLGKDAAGSSRCVNESLLQGIHDDCVGDGLQRSLRVNIWRRRPPQLWDAPVHLAWSKQPNFCLSSDHNRIENGAKVHLWECDQSFQSVGQNFVVDSQNRIRMHANREYCLVVDGDEFANGAKIQLWKCNERNDNQRWFTNLMGQVSSYKQPNFCVVIDGTLAAGGCRSAGIA
eukprot:Skav216814  [mRNA]  locus=scaffold135:125652:130382:- [translate_table: standard]